MSKTSPTRLAFLVPPGNPTCEPEMYRLAPAGVTVHFTRMVAVGGVPGAHAGQEERNRSQLAHLEENVEVLAMVKPAVMVLAHTASSYTLGAAGEAELVARMTKKIGAPFVTAFGAVMAAFAHLGVRRVAYGAPYSEEATLKGKAHLEANGIEVVNWGRLENVVNIYDETPERALSLARSVDRPGAEAVFLSGVGMPTIDMLAAAERELGKPVVSSSSAMMWHALRVAGVKTAIEGYGSLLAGKM